MKSTYTFRWLGAGALVLLLVIAALAVPGVRDKLRDLFPRKAAELVEDSFFTCPMHPEIRSPRMGACPICSMSLVERSGLPEGGGEYVSVTPDQLQLTGIKVTRVEKRSLYREIDAYGTIDYDETKLEVVAAWVPGRVEKLYVDFTGATVAKGRPLVKLYSPDLIAAKREYRIALNNLARVEAAATSDLVADARALVASSKQRLLWLGLSERQLAELDKSETTDDNVIIYAPQSGTVIKKEAYTGMYVKTGDPLFHIADVSRVWLQADIHENEIGELMERSSAERLPVEIETRAFAGEKFTGYISFADPFVNPETRTVRVRIDIDNHGRKLKPGMFARAHIRVQAGEVLAIPESAVLHSGDRTIAFVEIAEGRFEPREVRLGGKWLRSETTVPRSADLSFKAAPSRYHVVLAGLRRDEMVVTSGNFLLGSESQLQGALAKMISQVHEYDGERGDPEIPRKLIERTEPEFSRLLDAYLQISTQLANDTTKGIDESAATIVGVARSEAIRRAAEPFQQSDHLGDIELLREDFLELSNLMVAYVEQHKDELGVVPFKLHCPMKGDDGADWLQADKAVKNPYYGAKMLRCGSVKGWD